MGNIHKSYFKITRLSAIIFVNPRLITKVQKKSHEFCDVSNSSSTLFSCLLSLQKFTRPTHISWGLPRPQIQNAKNLYALSLRKRVYMCIADLQYFRYIYINQSESHLFGADQFPGSCNSPASAYHKL